MKTYCNPIDLVYRFKLDLNIALASCREGSDPGAVYWHGKYWCVPSKAAGVHWSDDLVTWHLVRDNVLPHEGYGPDLFVRNDRLYYDTGFVKTPVFEAIDPEHGLWKPVGEPYELCDQQLFPDSDGKLYCIHGCSPDGPIFGQEVNPETNLPMGDWLTIAAVDLENRGWERPGRNNSGEMGEIWDDIVSKTDGGSLQDRKLSPWQEGAFLIRRNGTYYLQASAGGTEYNIYADTIFTSDKPLGPYVLQEDNPLSLKPGGFITGAGHSCTMTDKYGNLFHFCTQRISRYYKFERRVGMFPAGVTEDGMMYCHQRFGDYPHYVPEAKIEDYENDLFTGWMLQSYHAAVTASSAREGNPAENAVDENIRTFWVASPEDRTPVLTLDLGHDTRIRAIQVNFSEAECKKFGFNGPEDVNCYLLEVSADGKEWGVYADQRRNTEDKTHRYHELDVHARFVRLTITSAAAGGLPAVSGLRVFGEDGSPIPEIPQDVQAERDANDRTRVRLTWRVPKNADGVNVRWGLTPERMHHTWQLNGDVTEFVLPSLNAEKGYFIALEAFGRGGVSLLSEKIKIE